VDALTAITILCGAAAAVDDLRRRQVSNWITGTAAAAGVACHAARAGWPGLGTALAGAAAGFAVFLLFYLMGGLGAGDVKLMAGMGALIGPAAVPPAAVMAALAGAAIALGALGWSAAGGLFRRAPRPAPAAIPYAPAIALGACAALLGRT
jgi:prepilin peptidase CpaA